MHLMRMEETAAGQPCGIDERYRVKHQRVAFPASNGVSVICRHDRLLWIVLTAIGWDDPIFALSATAIGILRVEKDDIVSRLDDPWRRALPWNPQRLAGHDRVFLVRPHVELLHLVPILGFVQWTIRPEPRGRFELEIHCLIDGPRTFHLRRPAATIPVTPIHSAEIPATRQVGLPVGHPRRLLLRCRSFLSLRGCWLLRCHFDRRLYTGR